MVDSTTFDDGQSPQLCIPNVQDIRVVPIEPNHLPQVCQIMSDAFASKRGCLCVPTMESLQELQKRYTNMPEAKWKLGAVAVDSQGTVLGYTQMTTMGLPVYPEGLHTCVKGEMYIEIVAVSGAAQGKGIGTKLLQWCHETSLSQLDIQRLKLEVLRGNRATGLYERFGFSIQKSGDCEDECCGAMLVCILFGRPYGICDEGWGSVEMEMTLERTQDMKRI